MRNRPLLRRFDITVFRDQSPTDHGQVPADALINFYKQGATVRTPITVPYDSSPDPTPTEIQVWHVGTVALGENVAVDASGTQLEVTGVDSSDAANMKLLVVNSSVIDGIPLAEGARLIRLADRPLVYLDSTGTTPTANSSTATDPATGRAVCYLREYRYDYTVTITGYPLRIFVDAEGSYVLQ